MRNQIVGFFAHFGSAKPVPRSPYFRIDTGVPRGQNTQSVGVLAIVALSQQTKIIISSRWCSLAYEQVKRPQHRRNAYVQVYEGAPARDTCNRFGKAGTTAIRQADFHLLQEKQRSHVMDARADKRLTRRSAPHSEIPTWNPLAISLTIVDNVSGVAGSGRKSLQHTYRITRLFFNGNKQHIFQQKKQKLPFNWDANCLNLSRINEWPSHCHWVYGCVRYSQKTNSISFRNKRLKETLSPMAVLMCSVCISSRPK